MGLGFAVGSPLFVGFSVSIGWCPWVAEAAVRVDLGVGEISWSFGAQTGSEYHVLELDVDRTFFVGHRNALLLFLVAPALGRRRWEREYSFKPLALALDDLSEPGAWDFTAGGDEFDWDRAPGRVDGLITGTITRKSERKTSGVVRDEDRDHGLGAGLYRI